MNYQFLVFVSFGSFPCSQPSNPVFLVCVQAALILLLVCPERTTVVTYVAFVGTQVNHTTLVMLIAITTILSQVSFVILQTASAEDETHPSSASSSPFSPSSAPPSVPSPSESLPPVASTVKSDDAAQWSFELLNYSSVCSLYDSNVHYLSAVKENVQSVYHYLVTRFLSLLTLWPSSNSAPQGDSYGVVSRLSGTAIGYHLYTLQTFLFRTETVAVICIFLIVALFVHSLFHYRERQRLAEATPLYSPLSAASPKSYHFLAKLVRCLNFTIFFTNVFGFVDSALRNFRSPETITVQLSYGHAGVYSLQGRRPNMEDCFSLKNNVSKELGIDYYAVYDGHGGPVCISLMLQMPFFLI